MKNADAVEKIKNVFCQYRLYVKKRKKKYKMTKNKARKRPVVCRSKMLEYKNDKRL